MAKYHMLFSCSNCGAENTIKFDKGDIVPIAPRSCPTCGTVNATKKLKQEPSETAIKGMLGQLQVGQILLGLAGKSLALGDIHEVSEYMRIVKEGNEIAINVARGTNS